MNESRVASVLIAGVMGVLTWLATSHSVAIPTSVQAVLVAGVTWLAGIVAPSITEFATRWRNVIGVVLSAAAAVVAFIVANAHGLPSGFQTGAVAVIAFLTSLLIPSSSHPSRLSPPPA